MSIQGLQSQFKVTNCQQGHYKVNKGRVKKKYQKVNRGSLKGGVCPLDPPGSLSLFCFSRLAGCIFGSKMCNLNIIFSILMSILHKLSVYCSIVHKGRMLCCPEGGDSKDAQINFFMESMMVRIIITELDFVSGF